MKATCLLVVFVLARLLILANRDISLSLWMPIAYLWQDLLIVLLFAALDSCTHRQPWIGWGLYGFIVFYTAVNVPVACVLSTPLTWPLLRATRGTLADSIVHHLTVANVLRLTLLLAVAALLPVLVRRSSLRTSRRRRWAAVSLAIGCVVLGPHAVTRVATLGLHRNVLTVLVTTALPRITAVEADEDWRRSPFGDLRAEDLLEYRGAAAGRNVVIIHLESTGASYLRPYGAAEDPMPHLTALARRAIVFENAYTTYPETIKSFFAVQCSRYPALDTRPEDYEAESSPALASVLAGAGYRTGLFHSGRFCYLGMESVLRNRGYQTLEDAGDIGGEHDSSFGIDEPSTVQRILRWIDALPAGQRFLVTYLPIAGHHPYETPEAGPFPEEEEINRYRNALHYSDAALNQLLQGLRDRGLEDQTLFLIFGDHGEAFGQHAGNYGHTLFIQEENVRVPYVIAAPGLFPESVRVRRVASLLDTAPTVCDLLGMPAPAEYQGHSLLDGQSGMALFCTDYSLGFLGLRDERWKFIHELESDRSCLYDLSEDPGENCDLASVYPERVEAYRDHVLRWAASQKYLLKHTR
jgi:glucan phosphoethanolaminetransferase (alkaline phosphatase superfamily)